MALKSMTGFGSGEAASGGLQIRFELSAVNRKQLDIRVGLPKALVALEARIYSEIQKVLSRGHVTGTIELSVSDDAKRKCVRVDGVLAAAYLAAFRRAARRMKITDDLSARDLMGLPDVVQKTCGDHDAEEVWPLARRALRAALKDLLAMRKREGANLARDISQRLRRLRGVHARLSRLAPSVQVHYAKALRARLKGLGVVVPTGDPQLAREIALFADRSDICEELSRLESHFGQAESLVRSSAPAGRAMDFLVQEMFREINTIGSKGNDARISRHVIDFKAELERVREQVQNVE